MQLSLIILITAFSITTKLYADTPVYSASAQGDFDIIYKNIKDSLEKNRLFVVFQPNIGANISGFAKRWGDNYNRNNLDNIKAMVFCNAWYANEMSNLDVKMTALCPLHITLIQQKGITTVNFVRPDMIAKDSKAASVAGELTELIIKSVTEGMDKSRK